MPDPLLIFVELAEKHRALMAGLERTRQSRQNRQQLGADQVEQSRARIARSRRLLAEPVVTLRDIERGRQ